MKATLTLVHIREKCIGCGSCAELAPEYWIMSHSDGKATLKQSERKHKYYVKKIDNDAASENLEAAEACPANIIQVHE